MPKTNTQLSFETSPKPPPPPSPSSAPTLRVPRPPPAPFNLFSSSSRYTADDKSTFVPIHRLLRSSLHHHINRPSPGPALSVHLPPPVPSEQLAGIDRFAEGFGAWGQRGLPCRARRTDGRNGILSEVEAIPFRVAADRDVAAYLRPVTFRGLGLVFAIRIPPQEIVKHSLFYDSDDPS
ncbi:hypothetical protein GWI33_012512 [Rhynchophorus ferrugineus]|uniref:Uncharacterized protein n=1 Tax=Rhynchophorus ferrugineus TaxID=354439 RepID=A0A834I5D9_RHYFE|nr:hypothetical protein GWI33_012512 [Rhynchophorus ferrugineus]